MPYAILVESCWVRESAGLLRHMARGHCHWGHAKYVLDHLGVPAGIAKLVYSAAIKRANWSTDDSEPVAAYKIRKLAQVYTDPKMVRVEGGTWVGSGDLSTPVGRGLENLLDSLPATQRLSSDGRHRRRIRVFGLMQGSGDLTEFGYPPLHVLRGVDMQPGRLPDGRVRIVAEAKPPFRRRPATEKEIAWAEAYLCEQFPGLNLNYLRLLLFGKAFAQSGLVEPPIVYAHGQSGSGKTMTVELAGEIGLSTAEYLKISTNAERFDQRCAAACHRTDFVIMDEIAKNRRNFDLITDAVLSLKLGKPYHEMFVGPRTITKLALVAICDTAVVPMFREEIQLARRSVEVPLGCGRVGGQDWKTTCNTGNVRGWRGSPIFLDNARAADVILNSIIDELPRYATFEAAAESLGYFILAKRTDDFDPNAALRELFDAVCDIGETPEGQRGWAGGFKGPGWVTFHLDNDRSGGVAKSFAACVGEMQENEQRLTGAQWGELLGAAGVELDYTKHGRLVGLRFRVGPAKSRTARFNRSIREESRL